MRFVLAILLVIAVPGCTLLSIATTESELIRTDELGTRTSSHAANVDGTSCYVDTHIRETHKAHVYGLWGLGGAVTAILVVIAGQAQKPLGAALAVDGTLAFMHLMIFQRRETRDVRWKQTLDTSYCGVGNVAKASSDKKKKDRFEPPPPRGPATRDSDGDGLDDEVDQCTLGAEDKDGFADDDGCPDDDNDRTSADGHPAVYEIDATNRVRKLFDAPKPIDAIAQGGAHIFFAVDGIVFDAVPGQAMHMLASLPGVVRIRYLAASGDGSRVFISDGNKVYVLERGNTSLLTATIGGALRIQDGALLVLDHKRRMLARIAGV